MTERWSGDRVSELKRRIDRVRSAVTDKELKKARYELSQMLLYGIATLPEMMMVPGMCLGIVVDNDETRLYVAQIDDGRTFTYESRQFKLMNHDRNFVEIAGHIVITDELANTIKQVLVKTSNWQVDETHNYWSVINLLGYEDV